MAHETNINLEIHEKICMRHFNEFLIQIKLSWKSKKNCYFHLPLKIDND